MNLKRFKRKKQCEILPLNSCIKAARHSSPAFHFLKMTFYLIIDQVKDGLTPKEQQLLPQLLMLLEQR